jgi:hypothetical protein
MTNYYSSIKLASSDEDEPFDPTKLDFTSYEEYARDSLSLIDLFFASLVN